MKILYLLMPIIYSDKIIKNIYIPSCRNCVHYKPYHSTSDFISTFNKCHKFPNKNIITNKIYYDSTFTVRNDENKCGNEGKYFEQNKNIQFKIFTHKIISIIPSVLLVSLIILTFIINIYCFTSLLI